MNNKNKKTVFGLTLTAMLAALSAVLMLIQFPAPFMPGFIKLDFSDLPGVFASMFISPIAGILVCLIKNVIHMVASESGLVGELSNFLLSSTFVFTSGIIYKYMKTRKGLIISGVCGAVAMGVISVPVNYFITYPMYEKFMPLSEILTMYNLIFDTDFATRLSVLLAFNLPFNIIKCLLNLVLAVLMYGAVQPVFKKYLK